eukprot:CAMPEP_0177348622 /NCGR_PEP_ID=MMETSP0368-20130122/30364_1 /TAXON_ID=447022 ORGANISM="Scrippsiella hangoei-like, Strain SHHI-4" /NCGR_SAMPLE_ID=MMETSP0368 /ASSEMBLY_ACC=CAM_ASM_000363 /LENGTH=246 /DNA_ID=CAMNT_0018810447 /DNA_START=106 /DNA_END=844 /DNA_ORIENTATION=-
MLCKIRACIALCQVVEVSVRAGEAADVGRIQKREGGEPRLGWQAQRLVLLLAELNHRLLPGAAPRGLTLRDPLLWALHLRELSWDVHVVFLVRGVRTRAAPSRYAVAGQTACHGRGSRTCRGGTCPGKTAEAGAPGLPARRAAGGGAPLTALARHAEGAVHARGACQAELCPVGDQRRVGGAAQGATVGAAAGTAPFENGQIRVWPAMVKTPWSGGVASGTATEGKARQEPPRGAISSKAAKMRAS